MYPTLFQLAGLAMAGWALLILLPGWSVTRRIAETAVFPVYLSVLYVIGIVPLVVEAGPGIMRDFGNIDGVLGLLRDPDVALIAWIHVLAFDHLIGVLIYRDNMRHRFVALPVQSVLLFFTLMFGPVGFVSYYVIRTIRRRRADVGLEADAPEPDSGRVGPGAPVGAGAGGGAGMGEAPGRDHRSAAPPAAAAMGRGGASATGASRRPRTIGDVVALARASFAREPGLTAVGCAGLVISALSLVAVAVRGPFIPPEGKMLDAVTFTFGVAIFTLTVALLLPLAGYSERGRRRYRRIFYAFPVYGLLIEPIQAFRGLDPRTSQVAGPADQIAGAVFGLTAIIVTVLFVVLAVRFFRRHVLSNAPLLRLGIRYGVVAVGISFAVGILMIVVAGRHIGADGNLLPAHGLGVHGIQAVPLVALLLVWSGDATRSAQWLHVAGLGWLAACTGAVVQALGGSPPLEPSPAASLTVAGLVTWTIAAGYAVLAWRNAARSPVVAVATHTGPATH